LRIYNPVKQAQDQDPQGIFVRRWVPELRTIPNEFIFQPWTMSPELQREINITMGNTYPLPIVDHLVTAKHARDTLWPLVRNPSMRSESRQVFIKHGSRHPFREGRSRQTTKSAAASGMNNTTQRIDTETKSIKSSEPSPQLSLGLDL
jgi:deoxyribodipyrimidine photo-lyase